MAKGFFMLSKDKLESWRWRNNPNKCYVFWSLLFKANFKPESFEKIVVNRGQLVFSYDKLSVELGVPLQTLRTTLKDLVETGDISIFPTRKWSLLTICEYDSWQNLTNQANTPAVTIPDTQTVTIPDTNIINNKEENKDIYICNNTPYNNPPIGDETKYVSLEEFNKLKEAFTSLSDENKKLREDIELSKKKSRSTFTPPTEEEVAEYIREKGYHFEASAFISFYESKGWMVGKNKMKDWKASCSGWESRNKQTKKSYDIYDINHSADNRDPHKYDRTMELWGIK